MRTIGMDIEKLPAKKQINFMMSLGMGKFYPDADMSNSRYMTMPKNYISEKRTKQATTILSFLSEIAREHIKLAPKVHKRIIRPRQKPVDTPGTGLAPGRTQQNIKHTKKMHQAWQDDMDSELDLERDDNEVQNDDDIDYEYNADYLLDDALQSNECV